MNDDLFYFLEGWADAAGIADISDGAAQCIMMEGVQAYDQENGTSHDPHDTWLEWIQKTKAYDV